MSLTFSTWKTAIANLTVVSETALTDMYPLAIDYAEGCCYRDLNLNDTMVRDSSASTAANTRTFTLPTPASGYFEIVQSLNIIRSDSRTPVVATTQDFIDYMWPTATAASATTVPTYYAMVTDRTLIFGPPPGDIFTVEVVGQIRPTPLSESNTTTILSTYYPELFTAASMVFANGWLKNFSAAADDPKAAMSWEKKYMDLLANAIKDDERARDQGDSWTANRASTAITQQRG